MRSSQRSVAVRSQVALKGKLESMRSKKEDEARSVGSRRSGYSGTTSKTYISKLEKKLKEEKEAREKLQEEI